MPQGFAARCAAATARPSSIVMPAWSILVVAFSIGHHGRRMLTARLLENQSWGMRRVSEDSQDMTSETMMWVGLTLAAMVTKLTSSTDDIVWLLPFVSGKHRLRNTVTYIGCMQLVVGIAWAFSAGGESALELALPKDSTWPMAKVLELSSAVLLTLYTLKLFREWWLERAEAAEEPQQQDEGATQNDQEAGLTDGQMPGTFTSEIGTFIFDDQVLELGLVVCWIDWAPLIDDIKVGCAAERYGLSVGDAITAINGISTWGKSRDEMLPLLKARPVALQIKRHVASLQQLPVVPSVVGAPAEFGASVGLHGSFEDKAVASRSKYTLKKLLTVSLLGSLDDFAVFVSILLSGLVSAVQLFLGVLLGSLIVVLICVAAGKLSCLVSLIERVPLWVIIGAFSTWSYISTFALD